MNSCTQCQIIKTFACIQMDCLMIGYKILYSVSASTFSTSKKEPFQDSFTNPQSMACNLQCSSPRSRTFVSSGGPYLDVFTSIATILSQMWVWYNPFQFALFLDNSSYYCAHYIYIYIYTDNITITMWKACVHVAESQAASKVTIN